MLSAVLACKQALLDIATPRGHPAQQAQTSLAATSRTKAMEVQLQLLAQVVLYHFARTFCIESTVLQIDESCDNAVLSNMTLIS